MSQKYRFMFTKNKYDYLSKTCSIYATSLPTIKPTRQSLFVWAHDIKVPVVSLTTATTSMSTFWKNNNRWKTGLISSDKTQKRKIINNNYILPD